MFFNEIYRLSRPESVTGHFHLLKYIKSEHRTKIIQYQIGTFLTQNHVNSWSLYPELWNSRHISYGTKKNGNIRHVRAITLISSRFTVLT